MESVEKSFGKVVRNLREKQGYSQEEFADRIETERSYYGGIERGLHNLSLQKIQKIITALDMSWASFFKHMDKK